MKNTILTKTTLIFLIAGFTGLLSAAKSTASAALFREYDLGSDKAIPYFDKEGNLLLRKSNAWTNTNYVQFYQNEEWEWEKSVLGESRSAKAVIHTTDNILYAGTYPNATIFKSTDDGQTWNSETSFADSSQSHVLTFFESTSGSIYAGTYPKVGVKTNARIYKLPYGKTEWIPLPSLPEGTGSDSVLSNRMVRDIVEDPEGSLYIAVRSARLYPSGSAWPKGEVWKSNNDGETWSTTGTIGGFYVQYTRSLLPLGNNIYVSTGTWTEGEVYKSSDGADTWEKIGGRLVGASAVWTLKADENGTIYAGSNYFYRLENEGENGETWERFSTPDGSDIRDLEMGSDGALYAGTIEGNIFRTFDRGETWELIGALKQNTNSFSIQVYDIVESNGAWYAATTMRPDSQPNDYYGTIFKGTYLEVSVAEEQSHLHSLSYSIYPNPLSQGNLARLNIDLPLGVTITELRIYNILGRLVKTMDLSRMTSGAHTNITIWDGKDIYGKPIANGVYLVSIRTRDSANQIKRIDSKLIYIR
ncbi:T9SS type A sorting domain-containing protein [Patescibacteria group bacterium AH-259-L05]|nr:T9SS type A sorting domain-containing protein [Patescibacteria group bacterium AH-259-L05]